MSAELDLIPGPPVGVIEAPALTLVVADDYPLFLEGLSRHLGSDERLRLLETASDGPSAVDACRRRQPKVALIGYHLRGIRGVALLEALRTFAPDTKIAVLAGIVEPRLVHEAVALGARGYLIKQESGEFILDALARIGQGATAFSPAAETCLVEAVRSRSDDSDSVPSPRESEILTLLAEGATAREMGDRLFVSEATVKTYLRRLYEKLSVSDRSAAVAEAMRRGWLA